MNVLFVASECAPFVKTGGLADVVAALPRALRGADVAVRVLLPLYPGLAAAAPQVAEVAVYEDGHFGPLRVLSFPAGGLDILALDVPHLYDRPGGPYLDPAGHDFPDNHLRFAVLSRAAARIARDGFGDFAPDVLHAHDWQAGLAPAYLRLGGDTRVRTVTTIHNIAFQGVFPAHTLGELDLPGSAFTVDGIEYHGHVSFLKAGLVFADAITTVSPTYARELMAPEYGLGFEGIIASRRDTTFGILNGVDLDVWNPATDPALVETYRPGKPRRRGANRAALLERFGLAVPPEAPLFCAVTRLTHQKGIDLLIEAVPRIVQRGGGLCILGAGEPGLEQALRRTVAAYPGRVGIVFGYDEPLSHLMQGGSDVIVVPSRFEPCGLTQLYGLRYGCLPLVARTGGLADTVIDANEAALLADAATGFQFAPITARALGDAIDRAFDLFARRRTWRRMMERAMRHPVGWDRSAASYRKLYKATAETQDCATTEDEE